MEIPKKYKESFEFIDNNLDITCDKILSKLRDLWTAEDIDKSINSEEEDLEFMIYLHAFIKFQESKGLDRVELSNEEIFFDYFVSFQIILRLAEIRERLKIPIKPHKIFDFDNYDNLNIDFDLLNQ